MILFYDSYTLRFGLFICGLSCLGSGLIIWNTILGGNSDHSFTMTAINTLLTYGELKNVKKT